MKDVVEAEQKASSGETSSRTTNPKAKKAYSLRLREETMEGFRALAKITNRSASYYLEVAAEEWLETHGKAKLEAIQKYCAGDRHLKPEDIPPSAPYTIEDAMSETIVLEGATGKLS